MRLKYRSVGKLFTNDKDTLSQVLGKGLKGRCKEGQSLSVR
jgi:hypothetical protein